MAEDPSRWSQDLEPARTSGWQRRHAGKESTPGRVTESTASPLPEGMPPIEIRIMALERAVLSLADQVARLLEADADADVGRRLDRIETAIAEGFQEGASRSLVFAEGTDDLITQQRETLRRIEHMLEEFERRDNAPRPAARSSSAAKKRSAPKKAAPKKAAPKKAAPKAREASSARTPAAGKPRKS